MNKFLLLVIVVLMGATVTFGQARTAEKIVSTPHSLLNQGNPPDGSVRYDISGTPGSSPCVGNGPGAFAYKTAGTWHCPNLSPGVGTGDTSGADASSAGEMVLFGDASGKKLARSNTLSGIPLLVNGQVSVLASSGTGNVARTSGATLTAPTLLTPTIGSFNNAQHTHDTAVGGGQLNASTVFSTGTIPPSRIITGTIINSRCLRVSNVGQIEVAAEDCGSGGGGGSPGGVSGNLIFNEAGSLGGMSNSAYDPVTGRLTLNQKANGNDTFYSQRFTNTTPTGSFIKFRNADGSSDLFLVSADGSVFLSSLVAWKNTAAPAVPTAGNTVVWTDLTDKNLKAQDSSGNVSITLRPISCSGTDKISSISSAGVVTCTADQGGTGTGVITLNTLSTSDQTFSAVDDANIDLSIVSSVSTHTFSVAWVGALSKARQHNATMYTDQSNTVTTGAQSFAAATSLILPTSAGAAPTTGGSVAYDSTSNTLEYGENGTNRLVVNTSGSQTLDNKTLANTTAATLRDTLMTLQDNVDSTKTLNFELSGITSGTNRVVAIPDANSVTVVPTTATTSQVVSHIDSAGVQQKIQLAFSNLTGSMGPTQGGTGLTAVAQGDLMYGDAANSWARLGKSTSASRYLANTGPSNNPQWDLVNVANGITGIVPADNGGTGNAFFQVSGTTASVKTFTFPNASSTVLTTATTVSVVQGGTGLTGGTSGGIPFFNSTSTIASSGLLTANAIVLGGGAGAPPTVIGSLGTTTTVLHGNAAGAPSFGQIVNADIATGAIDVTSKLTGILPGANGGTNNGFMQFSGPTSSLKTYTLPNGSATILTDAALVTAAQGGTNNAFFQVSGPATSTKTFTFPNASATVLTDNAAVSIAQGGSGQTTQTAAFNALDPLTTKGDIIVHDGTNSVRQAVGTNGFALLADSTQTNGVRWGAISASAGGSTTQIQYNSAGSLAGLSTVTTDGTIVTFAAGDLKVGSIALASAPTPALGKFYVQTDNGKLYFGIDGSNWGEVFVSGLSVVNLASANVTGVLPVANGGTGFSDTTFSGNTHKLVTTTGTLTSGRCVEIDTSGNFIQAAAGCGGGGGSGTVTVVSSGSLTSTALVTGGGTTTLQTPSATATLDSSGNMALPGSLTLSGSGAGYTELAEGTAPSAVANRVTVAAPTDVTAGGWVLSLPTTAGTTGQFLQTNGSGVTTWATPSGSGTVTATGGSLTSNAVVLGAGTTDTKVVAGIITDGTSKLTLGVAGTSVGSVDFKNATSGTITLSPVTGALGTVTLSLPARTATVATTTGTLTSGRCVEIDASGNFIQAAAACGSGGGSGTITAGATNAIPKYTATTTIDDSLLSDDATTLTYTGTGGISAPLFVATGTGAGYLELAEGTAPTVVANRLTFAAPADAPAAGLLYILPADTPTNGEQLTANISGTTVTLSWEAGGSGGITSLEGQTGATQTFTDDTNVTIVSSSNTHVITWAGTLAAARGGSGNGAPAQDQLLVGNGTGYDLKTLPSCSNATTEKLLYNSSTNTFSCGSDQTSGGGGGITTLNTLTGATQTFSKTDDTNVTLTITSTGTDHNFALGFTGTLADARVADNITLTNITQITNRAISDTTGDLAASRVDDGAAAATQALFSGAGSAAGFRAIADADIPDILTVTKIANLTSNGFVKTSAGDGTLSIDTNTYLTGNQTVTLSGDVTGTGATSITTVVANLPSGVTVAGFLAATAIAAPGTPAAGIGRLYVDSTSKNLAVKDDAGVVKHGVQTQSAVTNSFVTAISDAGAVTVAQPSFSNLSGSATDAQIPNTITIDLATTATTANSGDSATAFFSTGVLEVAIGGTGFTDTTFSGNTHKLVTTTGTLTSGRCVEIDASGNFIQAAAACGTGGSGANTALSNLASVAINTTLVSDTTNTDDLGTTSIRWKDLFLSGSIDMNGTGAGYIQLTEGTGPSLVANTVQHVAAADAPAGGIAYVWGAAAANGILYVTNSSGTMTVNQGAGISQLVSSSSADLASVLNDEQGSGGGFVRATSPTLTTPALGVATATSINGLTITTSTGTLTITNAKTLAATNSLTLSGTDGTVMTFPSTSATIARTDAANTFTGTQTVGALVATTVNGNTFTTGTGTLTIAAGKTATVSNTLTFAGTDSTTQTFQASDTIVGRATTDTLTNKTIDVAATGNNFTSSHKVWLAAAGCSNTTASSFWDLPTTTPMVATCATGTNTQAGRLDAADTSGGFSAQNSFLNPEDFTGTVDARIVWQSAATSGNVKFALSTVCTAVDATETDDAAFSTASTVTTAVPGVANRLQTSAITSLTITTCAAGEFFHVKLFRDGNDAADTASATVRVVGVELTLKRAQ